MNTSEYNSVSSHSYLDCLYWIAGRRTACQWLCIFWRSSNIPPNCKCLICYPFWRIEYERTSFFLPRSSHYLNLIDTSWNIYFCQPFVFLLWIARSCLLLIFFYSVFFFSTVKVAQSCPTLCNRMDYTVHGILQARILEWVAFPFSRGSSQPRERTQVSRIVGRFFISWATRESPLIYKYSFFF